MQREISLDEALKNFSSSQIDEIYECVILARLLGYEVKCHFHNIPFGGKIKKVASIMLKKKSVIYGFYFDFNDKTTSIRRHAPSTSTSRLTLSQIKSEL